MRDIIGGFRLTFAHRMSYSVGHVQNDLCASMWFTYLLLFMRNVAGFSNKYAGYLMLWGQVIDALCTPFIGIISDRTQGFCHYGKRKSWHAIGCLCVVVSFPFVFMRCYGIDCSSSENLRFLYYAFYIAIFQFGWAATQVAHLALIPELTQNDSERVELNAFRNAFTILSSVAVYGMAWFLFSQDAQQTQVNASEFMFLMSVCTIVGSIFSFIFHVGTNESKIDVKHLDTTHNVQTVGCIDWLKQKQFYLIATMYMCSRLIVNVSQTYWSLYLTDSLKLAKHYIAIVPLVVFGSGFVVSLIVRKVIPLAGSKMVCLAGLFLTIFSCSSMWFLVEENAIFVLLSAIFMGSGGSILLITSLTMTSDLIGSHLESSAFVFGAVSFADKLSSGVCIFLIQIFHPCTSSECCPDCAWYYRNVMVLLPNAVAAISVIVLFIIAPMKLGKLLWNRSERTPKEPMEFLRDTIRRRSHHSDPDPTNFENPTWDPSNIV